MCNFFAYFLHEYEINCVLLHRALQKAQDILVKNEALCSTCNWKREKFLRVARTVYDGSRV